MMTCDVCNHGYHIWCLDEPMLTVHDGEWKCPRHSGNPQPYIGQGLGIFSISMSLITASCRKEKPNTVIHFVEKDTKTSFNSGIYLYIPSQQRIKVRTVGMNASICSCLHTKQPSKGFRICTDCNS